MEFLVATIAIMAVAAKAVAATIAVLAIVVVSGIPIRLDKADPSELIKDFLREFLTEFLVTEASQAKPSLI